MYFIQVGIHYRTSNLSVREQFVFPEEHLSTANQQLNNMPYILENVIISTCNRTEIYAVVNEQIKGYHSIIKFLTQTFSIPSDEIEEKIEVKWQDPAITHLLRVTAGLDSMIVGETEILGQIKHAYFTAKQANSTKKMCNEIFKRAITLGKQAHHETQVSSYPTSISHLAVQLCAEQVPNFSNRRVLVVGAGTIGMSTVNQLISSNVKHITLINRSVVKAQKRVNSKRIEVLPYDALYEQLSMADVVFFAVRKEEFVLTKHMAEKTHKTRGDKPMWLIDLAVPRNIDPSINTVEQMIIYDMDYFQQEMRQNQTLRNIATRRVERLVDNMFDEVKIWKELTNVHPVIQALQSKGHSIQDEVFTSIVRKLPTLTERERKVIEQHTTSIVNQLLKEPIIQLKQKGNYLDETLFLQTFATIFGIDKSLLMHAENINSTQKPKKLTDFHVHETNKSLSEKRARDI